MIIEYIEKRPCKANPNAEVTGSASNENIPIETSVPMEPKAVYNSESKFVNVLGSLIDVASKRLIFYFWISKNYLKSLSKSLFIFLIAS